MGCLSESEEEDGPVQKAALGRGACSGEWPDRTGSRSLLHSWAVGVLSSVFGASALPPTLMAAATPVAGSPALLMPKTAPRPDPVRQKGIVTRLSQPEAGKAPAVTSKCSLSAGKVREKCSFW